MMYLQILGRLILWSTWSIFDFSVTLKIVVKNARN